MSQSGEISASRTRSASRIRRFTRFRSTAFPNARGTVNPSLGPLSGWRSTRRQNAAKHRPVIRFPSLYALRKSAVRRIRAVFGKPKLVGVPDGSLVANGEFVAAFGPAPGEHVAPIFGGHAYAESMCLCPFAVVWLKGAFWHFGSSARASTRNVEDFLNFSIVGGEIRCQTALAVRPRSNCHAVATISPNSENFGFHPSAFFNLSELATRTAGSPVRLAPIS
jgi:hypothetical protein